MRLRLVKVVCQAHLVAEDDDGNLSEQVSEPVTVAAKDWPAYSGTTFPRELERLETTENEGGIASQASR